MMTLAMVRQPATEKTEPTEARNGGSVFGFPPLEGNRTTESNGRLLIFDVLGDAKAAPRPKARVIGFGKSAHAHIYVPSVADEWKHEVRAAAKLAIMTESAWGPGLVAPGVAVAVYLAFRFRRPKSHLRTGRHSGKLRPSAPKFHTQKPDKDNLEKAVLDALGIFDGLPNLVWCDDSQVVDGRTSKRWADPGEEPGAAVAIMELNR